MWEEPSERSTTVLVVDDDPISRNVFVNVLATMGLTVLEAANIQQAVTLCRTAHRKIDLLIGDFILTDGRGTELAAKIREHCPDIPVLLTSGTPVEAWAATEQGRFDDLGVRADFLAKPFRASELASKVARLLAARGGTA